MPAAHNSVYGDVVLITGASSGIGKYMAEAFANAGFKVYGTSRNPSQEYPGNHQKSFPHGGFIRMLRLDVTSTESVGDAVEKVLSEEGRISILVNNAGFGLAGAVEDTTPEEAFSQMDTNFFGVCRMCRAVMPHMRAAGRGLIINVGSVAGFIAIPFQAFYSASKYALEALTEALRHELSPFGIKVTLLEPGDTKTGFTGKRQVAAGAAAGSAYSERFQQSIDRMARDEMSGPEPVAAARQVLKLACDRNPPIRRVLGFQYKAIAFFRKLLPSRVVEFAVSMLYGGK